MTQDVTDLIMADHRELERMFDELRTDRSRRAVVVPLLTTLLTAHSRAEESEVYPVARAEAGESEEVEHSQEEHLLADRLMAELAEIDGDSAAFDSKLEELVDAVTHHLQEEEKSVLPGIRERLTETRRAELGERFLAVRQEHLGEQVDDATKADLAQQAANLQMPVGDRDKDELRDALLEKGQK